VSNEGPGSVARWRTNISLGGSAEGAAPPLRAQRLALAAARGVGADLVGVDLLPFRGDYIVIELNGCVDFNSSYSLSGSEVFAEIAAALGFRPPVTARSTDRSVLARVESGECGDRQGGRAATG